MAFLELINKHQTILLVNGGGGGSVKFRSQWVKGVVPPLKNPGKRRSMIINLVDIKVLKSQVFTFHNYIYFWY